MDFRTEVVSAKLDENTDINIEALSLGGEEVKRKCDLGRD